MRRYLIIDSLLLFLFVLLGLLIHKLLIYKKLLTNLIIKSTPVSLLGNYTLELEIFLLLDHATRRLLSHSLLWPSLRGSATTCMTEPKLSFDDLAFCHT